VRRRRFGRRGGLGNLLGLLFLLRHPVVLLVLAVIVLVVYLYKRRR
jgi:4-amino-4-deoxy-L-arabinose transferase-like glycosyltransferase